MRNSLYYFIIFFVFYNFFLAKKEKFSSDDHLTAFIINGDKHGKLNEKRWVRPYHICSDILGLPCHRIPSFYVTENGKTEINQLCGKTFADSVETRNVSGTNNAHRKALEAVLRYGERSIIFEDDIILPLNTEEAVSKIDNFIKENKDADVAYLGHCFNGACLHAYIVAPKIAKKLLEKIDWCSIVPFDEQLKKLCKNGDFKCSYAETLNSPRVKNSWGKGIILQEGEPVRVGSGF